MAYCSYITDPGGYMCAEVGTIYYPEGYNSWGNWSCEKHKKGETKPMKNKHWGPGPWDGEDDSYYLKYGDYHCFIKRNESTGNLCGYIGVPKNHPWAKADDIYDMNIDVHGGITYYESYLAGEAASGMLRWLGFDCAHWDDLIPANSMFYAGKSSAISSGTYKYKTVEFVKKQLANLAAQAQKALDNAEFDDGYIKEFSNPCVETPKKSKDPFEGKSDAWVRSKLIEID